MELDSLIEGIKESLKNNGYKKKGLNWYKVYDNISIVFNIQKSQFDANLWYYNFGIGLNELEAKPVTIITKCHIVERINKIVNGKETAPDVLLTAISNWKSNYGNISKLQNKAIENKLPKMTTRQARSHLTQVRF